MNRRMIWATLFALTALGGLAFIFFGQSKGASQRPSGTAELADVSFTKRQEREVKGAKIENFEGRTDGLTIQLTRMQNLDGASAEKLIQQRRFEIEGLGRNQAIAYPGEFSEITGCENMMKPHIEIADDSDRTLFRTQLPATERNAVGVCLNDEMSKLAVIAYWYCKSKRVLFHTESFFPQNQIERANTWLKDPAC